MKIDFNAFFEWLNDDYLALFWLVVMAFIVVFVVIIFFNEDEC